MTKIYTIKISLAILLLSVLATGRLDASTISQAQLDRYHEFFHGLGAQNRMSPVETAASHGITGWRLGMGLVSSDVPEDSQELAGYEVTSQTQRPIETLVIPKIWMTKGLFYPVDIGFNYGASLSHQLNQVGGYLQWSIYEAFALPAVAIRGGMSRIFGLASTEIKTESLELVSSYGVGIFAGYIGFGFHNHSVKYGLSAADESLLGYDDYRIPRADDIAFPIKYGWQESTTTLGFQFQIAPPFVQLSFEGILSDYGSNTYQGKVSIGI